jgi:hypothetical protein
VLQQEAPSLFFDFEIQIFEDSFPAVVHLPANELCHA